MTRHIEQAREIAIVTTLLFCLLFAFAASGTVDTPSETAAAILAMQ